MALDLLQRGEMDWYYHADGQRLGPILQAHFDELVRIGAVTPQTLVWCEGMVESRPYAELGLAEWRPFSQW
ncbi:MAG: DUF4339 domain-containing protein [Verrucomicrobiota bacterium]|nr:DUF4339 domain-containing protein [Verrucomicrobiota bacterium]